MLKKLPHIADEDTLPSADGADPALAASVPEAAQRIWLAGLGAYARAQAEGGKVFEALVQEGVSLQRKTQALAEDSLAALAARVGAGVAGQPGGQLETIFETRIAQALTRLGVPLQRDLETLLARIERLDQAVAQLANQATQNPDNDRAGRPAP
ncbi:phasin family protein [Caldimonas brevitalea]|uniref:Polyhydroxyalkanoate granule-associated protein PhaF n=1 Tax=Caldimonas brevitalea TaxID=413882 RepID=A0A0G3BXU4_9BURK|nr:phasin family protein [Caldimonas brevitalea]AKJ31320.1 polyhydroxyalkanoate granule-associated protein PhaF [Caldimonas brevitalea]